MKKIFNGKICASIVSLFLVLTIAIPAPAVLADGAADFETGKAGTWFVVPWEHEVVTQKDNFFPLFFVKADGIKHEKSSSVNIRKMAEETKAYTDKMPDGKRGICISNYLTNLMLSNTEDPYPWFGGYNQLAEVLDDYFSYYKRIGGKDLNFVITDPEYGAGPWNIDAKGRNNYGFKTTKDVFDDFVKNPHYINEVRPELVRLGFEFCTEPGENELKYAYEDMYSHELSNIGDLRGDKLDNFYKLQAATINYQAIALYECVYVPTKKHFPDAFMGDYSQYITVETDTPSPQGHIWKYRRDAKAGNLSTRSAYGYNFLIGSKLSDYFPGYPYDKVDMTLYNSFFLQMQNYKHIAIYTQNSWVTPWVGTYDYVSHNMGNDRHDYWQEYRFHAALNSKLPFFLYFTAKDVSIPNDDCDMLLSRLMKELDEVLGFEDRQPLAEEIQPWDSKYVLSGMSANGKNVWRITPDLCYSNFNIEDFLYDEENVIFKIANQFVDFPEGSFIYKTKENTSMFGYWVISPEGTRPHEYRDESLPIFEHNDLLNTHEAKAALQQKAINSRMLQGETYEEAYNHVLTPWMRPGGKAALSVGVRDMSGEEKENNDVVLKSYRDEGDDEDMHISDIGLQLDLQ